MLGLMNPFATILIYLLVSFAGFCPFAWANCDPERGLVDTDKCFPSPPADRTIERLDPRFLLAAIETGYLDYVVWQLRSDEQFEWFESQVASGKPVWLDVAVALYRQPILPPLRDCLEDMIAHALPYAPARVLPLIGTEFSVESICTSPRSFVGESRPLTPQQQLRHLERAELTLDAFPTRRFADAKLFCLVNLQHLKAELLRRQAEEQPVVERSSRKRSKPDCAGR